MCASDHSPVLPSSSLFILGINTHSCFCPVSPCCPANPITPVPSLFSASLPTHLLPQGSRLFSISQLMRSCLSQDGFLQLHSRTRVPRQIPEFSTTKGTCTPGSPVSHRIPGKPPQKVWKDGRASGLASLPVVSPAVMPAWSLVLKSLA